MVPLIIAPTGGHLGAGQDALAVQRTFANARSVEFDALLLAGAPVPGADAYGARDAKAGEPSGPGAAIDPRVLLMVSEAFRHGKAIGGWGGVETALQAAGITDAAAGVVLAGDGVSVLEQVTQLLGEHRVWDRFPAAV